MFLPHCPRDGSLMVYDAGHWQCLLCAFEVRPAEKEYARGPVEPWPWPPEANPMHERHTAPPQEDGD